MNIRGALPTREIERLVADFPGRIGFFIEDLTSGGSYEHAADERFPVASIFKVPIMIELFRQVEQGELSLDERRRLRGDISTHNCGVLHKMQGEPELTLRDYCELMIGVSDDMAADLLLQVVGLPRVNQTMTGLGFVNTRVCMPIGRWHYLMVGLVEEAINRQNDLVRAERARAGQIDFDSLPFQESLENNVSTPREMATIFERIYRGKLIGESASAQMLEMLKGCRHRNMIPRHLTPETAVAHKVGQSNRIRGDAGIVFLPTGPLVIAGLSLAIERGDQRPGREAIAEVSRLVVQAVCPQSTAD